MLQKIEQKVATLLDNNNNTNNKSAAVHCRIPTGDKGLVLPAELLWKISNFLDAWELPDFIIVFIGVDIRVDLEPCNSQARLLLLVVITKKAICANK